MNAIDQFLDFEARRKEKTAAFAPEAFSALAPQVGREIAEQGFLRTLGRTTAGIGTVAIGSMAVGAGLQAAGRLIDHVTGSFQRAKGYKAMVEANPDLQKMDRKKVEMAYNTLHKFNPEMASDPLVSSSFVRRTAEMGQVTPMDVGNLMAARDRARRPSAAEMGAPFAAPGAALADRAREVDRQVQLQQALLPMDVARQAALAPGEVAKSRAVYEMQSKANLKNAPTLAYQQEAGKIQAQERFGGSLTEQKAYLQEKGKSRFQQDQETSGRSAALEEANRRFEEMTRKKS